MTRLHYSAFHNFKKLQQFINAGLIYYRITLRGKRRANGFVSWRIITYLFALASMEGAMGRPIMDFHFSLLARPNHQAGKRNQ